MFLHRQQLLNLSKTAKLFKGAPLSIPLFMQGLNTLGILSTISNIIGGLCSFCKRKQLGSIHDALKKSVKYLKTLKLL